MRAKWVIADVVNASLTAESYYARTGKYPLNPKQLMASYEGTKLDLQPSTHLIFQTDGVNGYCILGYGISQYLPPNYKVYDSARGGLMVDSVHSCSQFYPISFTVSN